MLFKSIGNSTISFLFNHKIYDSILQQSLNIYRYKIDKYVVSFLYVRTYRTNKTSRLRCKVAARSYIHVDIRKHVAVNIDRFVVIEIKSEKKKQTNKQTNSLRQATLPSGYIRASNFLIAFPSDIFMVGYFRGSVGSSGRALLFYTLNATIQRPSL